MVLLVDMGNTRLNMAGWEEGKAVFSAETPTDRGWTAGSCAAALAKVLAPFGVGRWEGCALSSVVPALTDAVRQALFSVTGREPVVLGTSNISFRVLAKDPVGADMLAGAEGAMARVPMPAIVADLGTATTIEVVDQGNTYLGGAIIPGVRVSAEALSSRTAQLPGIQLDRPKRLIGKNTVECMRSGIMYGAAAMLDGMIERMEEELGKSTTVVATGGMAQFVAPLCKREMKVEKDLLLKGLNAIYKKNKK